MRVHVLYTECFRNTVYDNWKNTMNYHSTRVKIVKLSQKCVISELARLKNYRGLVTSDVFRKLMT